MANAVPSRVQYAELAIANGQSLSNGLPLYGRVLCGVVTPTSWTAADLSFQSSLDGSTWRDLLVESGGEMAEVVWPSLPAGSHIAVANNAPWYAVPWLRLRSGVSGAAVNQGGTRTFTLLLADSYG